MDIDFFLWTCSFLAKNLYNFVSKNSITDIVIIYISFRCSIFVLVFDYWPMNQVIYLILRQKYLFLQAEETTFFGQNCQVKKKSLFWVVMWICQALTRFIFVFTFNPKRPGLFGQLNTRFCETLSKPLPIFTPDQQTVSHMKAEIFS